MPGEVTGSWNAFDRNQRDSPVAVDARFEDNEGTVIYEQHSETTGDFHFVAAGEGEYKLCFTAADYHSAQLTRIGLTWRSGAEAHNWQEVAKKENLNVVQTELLKLEQTVHDVHLELQYIRRKEEQMRDINELINTRVAWFSITALLICAGMAGWQLYYLQRFLKRKKVI